MRHSRTIAMAALLGLVTLPAGAQEPKLPEWLPTLEAGFAAAKKRGQAVMVALNMDRERGNQQMLDEVYTSDEVLEATEHCVPVIASMFDHGLTRDDKSGKNVCKRFRSVTCDEHRAIEQIVRGDWLGRGPKDDVESPRHFFLSPDGKILFQRVWTMTATDLAALMRRASELCTPERLEVWDTLEGRLERAQDPIASVREIALADLIAENDRAIDETLAKLAKKSKDGGVVGSVLGAFAQSDTPERRKLSHAALSHKHPEVRMRAAYAMQKSGHEDHLAPLLARAPKDKDEKAKAAIYRAIGVLGPEDKKVRKVLLKGVGNGKDPARAHAAVAIAPWAKEDAVKDALRKITLQGGDTGLRSAAVWTLGYSEDKDVIEDLQKLRDSLGRWDWRLRGVVKSAIDKLRGRDVGSAYDNAPDQFLPHPVEDDGKRDEERGPWGR